MTVHHPQTPSTTPVTHTTTSQLTSHGPGQTSSTVLRQVRKRDGRIVAIEVKLAASVTEPDVQHLAWLRSRLPEDVADLVILTTGTTAYRRRDGVAVIPLALLVP